MLVNLSKQQWRKVSCIYHSDHSSHLNVCHIKLIFREQSILVGFYHFPSGFRETSHIWVFFFCSRGEFLNSCWQIRCFLSSSLLPSFSLVSNSLFDVKPFSFVGLSHSPRGQAAFTTLIIPALALDYFWLQLLFDTDFSDFFRIHQIHHSCHSDAHTKVNEFTQTEKWAWTDC